MAPGKLDPSLTAAVLCNTSTKRRWHVTASGQVFAAYNIAPQDRWRYELDHDVPLAPAGTNRAANLWPQPEDEAALKDALEVEMQRLVCHGLLPFPQAQREMADDGVAAYDRYVLHDAVTSSVAPPRPTLSQRLRATVRRLSRSWISGSE